MENKLKRRLDRIRSRSPTHPRSPDPGPRELEPPFGLSLASGAILRRGSLTISDLHAGLAEEDDVFGFADSAPIDAFEKCCAHLNMPIQSAEVFGKKFEYQCQRGSSYQRKSSSCIIKLLLC